MEIQPVTQEAVIGFAASTIIPVIVDTLRIATFQILMRLKLKSLADMTTTSKFGLLSTYLVCLLFGVVFSIWFGNVEPNIMSILQNSLIVLGWSQVVYKAGYEKSDLRKVVVTAVDKLGPKTKEIDSPADEIKEEISSEVKG